LRNRFRERVGTCCNSSGLRSGTVGSDDSESDHTGIDHRRPSGYGDPAQKHTTAFTIPGAVTLTRGDFHAKDGSRADILLITIQHTRRHGAF
ncbi:MAG: hypothetical protein OSA83_11990, partial [Pseudomonadales bacterium]|nr:hypothetical protein [Pseudomonadales bacterium]